MSRFKSDWEKFVTEDIDIEKSYIGSINFLGNYSISPEAGDIRHIFEESNSDLYIKGPNLKKLQKRR